MEQWMTGDSYYAYSDNKHCHEINRVGRQTQGIGQTFSDLLSYSRREYNPVKLVLWNKTFDQSGKKPCWMKLSIIYFPINIPLIVTILWFGPKYIFLIVLWSPSSLLSPRPIWSISCPLSSHITLTWHSCPEAKTQLTELFNGTFNRFLVHFGHIFQNCKAWNPGLKEIEDISL